MTVHVLLLCRFLNPLLLTPVIIPLLFHSLPLFLEIQLVQLYQNPLSLTFLSFPSSSFSSISSFSFVSLLVSCFVFPVRYSSATLCSPNFHFILNILAFVASFWFLICFFVFLFTSFFLLCCLSYLFCICLFLGFFHSCHPHLPFLNSPLPFQLTRCFPSASISCLPSNLFICHVLLLSEFLCLLHFVFSFFLFIFPFLFIFLSAYLSVLLTFDSFFLMFLPFSLHSPIWTSAWLTFTLITSSSLSFFLFSSLSLILSPIRFHLLHLI